MPSLAVFQQPVSFRRREVISNRQTKRRGPPSTAWKAPGGKTGRTPGTYCSSCKGFQTAKATQRRAEELWAPLLDAV
jgi:hypothetical protein